MSAQPQNAGPLSLAERRDLVRLEEVVGRGIGVFWEVGRALEEISSRRLYRATHARFEDYCQARWGFSRQRAYQLVGAAEVMDDLAAAPPVSTRVDIYPMPASEKQIRPLATLPAEQRREVWEQAVEDAGGEQPTAADVADLVAEARAALSPENRDRLSESERLRALRAEEEAVLRRSGERQQRRERDARDKHREQTLFHLRQAARHAAAIGPEGEGGLAEIEEAAAYYRGLDLTMMG